MPVSSLLCRSACRISLDEIQLGLLGRARGAVCQLSGKSARRECALALDELAGLPRGQASLRGQRDLIDDRLRLARMILEPLAQLFVDEGLDGALHLGVSKLRLRLALELRLCDFHR